MSLLSAVWTPLHRVSFSSGAESISPSLCHCTNSICVNSHAGQRSDKTQKNALFPFSWTNCFISILLYYKRNAIDVFNISTLFIRMKIVFFLKLFISIIVFIFVVLFVFFYVGWYKHSQTLHLHTYSFSRWQSDLTNWRAFNILSKDKRFLTYRIFCFECKVLWNGTHFLPRHTTNHSVAMFCSFSPQVCRSINKCVLTGHNYKCRPFWT